MSSEPYDPSSDDIASILAGHGLSTLEFRTLQTSSRTAQGNAYCPYSNFRVGAAVLTASGPDDSESGRQTTTTGEVVGGANVENAAYPVGTCAERVALGAAVAKGFRKFRAIAVATDILPPASPCGMCRQFLREFLPLDAPIIMFGKDDKFIIRTLQEGRLNQVTLNLLEGADIQFRRESRLDIALVKNLPIALIFLPAADIPTFVGQGRVDLGITGWDQVQEYEAGIRRQASRSPAESPASETATATPAADIKGSFTGGCKQVMDLGFGACKLQVQAPAKGVYTTATDLLGKTICTSFVNLATEFFARLEQEAAQKAGTSSSRPRTKIIEIGGSVEAACALGVADGIVDLVESGETMRAAGLKAIDTVMETQAVLIQSDRSASSVDASSAASGENARMVELIASRIRGVIAAQQYVLCQYNIERARLDAAKHVTPGKRAPTVTNLDMDGWVAVSAMVEKKRVALTMDELVRVGAQDILVLDIHNTR